MCFFSPGTTTPDDTFLHYGMEVLLKSTLTGMVSGVMVVRKVEKSTAVLHSDEPVSQLHKVAFQFKDSDHMYLALLNDSITMQRAVATDANAPTISDAAAWTIVGTESVQYNFYEGVGTLPCAVTPVPVVESIKVQNRLIVELYGENFLPNLVVWFGESPAFTRYRCEELVTCEPPPLSAVTGGRQDLSASVVEVPILLVRSDGVVYNTGKKYTYTPEPLLGAR